MTAHLGHTADIQEMVGKPTNPGSFRRSYWKEQAIQNKTG